MASSGKALSMAEHPPARRGIELPHKYIGGDPSVDFVNTVDWTSSGLVDERLSNYARLTRWAEGAAVISPRIGIDLRRLGERHPGPAEEVLESAHLLRDVLHRAFAMVAAGRRVDRELDALAPFIGSAAAHRELAPFGPIDEPRRAELESTSTTGAAARWRWHDADADLSSPLWIVAWRAAELLASAEAAQLRICAGTDCGWMYVDRSRNGLRRWCQMGECGTRAKSRRRAERRRGDDL